MVDASTEEYEEINDILNRYTTLVDVNDDLKNQIKAVENEVFNLKY